MSDQRTDWQKRCLELGFTYVRESDDHYVLADVPEMARLLGELLGVEVRDRENDTYGETVSELQEQIDAANRAFHQAYEAEKRLKFVLEQQITISHMNGTRDPEGVYRCQWPDCAQDEWYKTPVQAIDEAMRRDEKWSDMP